MEKLWTTSEVAACLGIHEADVEQLVRQGKLTGYKLGGQFLRFRPDQVTALKGTLPSRSASGRSAQATRGPLIRRVKDFVYFYDFYIVSATLLALTVAYLLVAG